MVVVVVVVVVVVGVVAVCVCCVCVLCVYCVCVYVCAAGAEFKTGTLILKICSVLKSLGWLSNSPSLICRSCLLIFKSRWQFENPRVL